MSCHSSYKKYFSNIYATTRKWGSKDGMALMAKYMFDCPPCKWVPPPPGMVWGVCSKCGAGYNFSTGEKRYD